MSENLNLATDPVMLDQTGQRIAESLEGRKKPERIITLNEVPIADKAVEAIGIPKYVDDISEYEAYRLTETGWYLFVRIFAKEGVKVCGNYSVVGAAGCVAAIGENYIDVAIQFDVASLSKLVTVNWGLESETFVFKATDLAIRNLDYRSTFYVYDISGFATWEYTRTADHVFAADKHYYKQNGEEYENAEVTEGAVTSYYELGYALTADTTFAEGKTYYTKDEEGNYVVAEVTVGDDVTADTYYEYGTVYALTADTTFAEGKTYYTTTDGSTYTEAEVTVGAAITVYYNHSKLIFSGMTRNVTYRLDEIVDAPIEIVLPTIPDDGYGCWFEIQMRFSASHSITLTPIDTDVKIGTATTQAQTAGINVVDLQYTDVDDIKMWTLLNTHSNIPTT